MPSVIMSNVAIAAINFEFIFYMSFISVLEAKRSGVHRPTQALV